MTSGLKVELCWSDDGGKNKTPWRVCTLAAFQRVARFRKLGSSKDRRYYLRVSEPVKRDLLAASGLFVK